METYDLTMPPPTPDPAEAKRHLDEFGLCVLTGVISPQEVAEAVARLDEQAAAEDRLGLGHHDGGPPGTPPGKGPNQRMSGLVNKGAIFRQIAMKPVIDEIFTYLLEPGWLFHQMAANIARPGGVPMGLHADQPWAPPQSTIPYVVNGIWALDAFTEENGATRVVPRSHRFGRYPNRAPGAPPTPTVPALAPAGSIFFYDGRLWHSTGANVTRDQSRRGILCGACRPWIRTQDLWALSLSPETIEAASPEFLRRLGFARLNAVGGISAWPGEGFDARGLLRRPTRWLGELH